MRKFGIGLAAVLTLAIMAPATMVMAARKPAEAAGGVDAKSREKGMTDAPALITATGLSCTLTDARWIGADAKTKSGFYEIACNPGLGGVIVATAGNATPPQFYPCLETGKPGADGKPGSLACKLPANADPAQALAPFVAKANAACDIDKARSIGASTHNTFFEVACKNGSGLVLVTSYPADPTKDVKANTCLAYEPGSNLACQLTTREAQLAMVDTLAAAAGKNCVVKDKRYILSAVNGSTYFEVSCQDGKGYVLERAPNGSLARAIDCANAPGGAECTLTDAREAKTEQAGLYTRLATKAGFPCKVEKYALFPARVAREEVVELKCSDRPDGGVAVFDSTGDGKVYNCIVAELQGYGCSFTPKAASVVKISSDLKSLGKGSCVVSDARVIGKTETGEGFIEVACADGLPGWVINYPPKSDTPKEVLSCKQASGIGGGCKLPTNKVSN
jgi:hypothetical protein